MLRSIVMPDSAPVGPSPKPLPTCTPPTRTTVTSSLGPTVIVRPRGRRPCPRPLQAARRRPPRPLPERDLRANVQLPSPALDAGDFFFPGGGSPLAMGGARCKACRRAAGRPPAGPTAHLIRVQSFSNPSPTLRLPVFEIVFLGTSASAPSIQRGLPAQVVMHREHRFLIDCGEGTQRQILQSGLGFKRVGQDTITPAHLDHILGLAGLLSTFARWETMDRLEIWAGSAALARIRDLLFGGVLRGARAPTAVELWGTSAGGGRE